MKVSLAKKLLLAFIGLTFVVLLATLSLARWSFEQGFLDYTNALEQQRLTRIAERLSSLYQQRGEAWSAISSQELNQYLDDSLRPPPPRHRPPPNDKLRPPRSHQRPETALVNTQQSLLAGQLPQAKESDWIRVPVRVKQQTIAELITASKRHFSSPQATAFSKQQWITSAIIACVAMGLALLVSLRLTQVLLAPIRRMLLHVSQISNGDYHVRLDEPRNDELGRLMKDLDRLTHQLEENQSARQRWIADISHELRTPVTVLIGEIHAIQDGLRPLGMTQIHSLEQEVERISHLIDDLYQLSLADIGALRYQFYPLLLDECLINCIDKARVSAERKGLHIVLENIQPAWVNADAQRLTQLFHNLLLNAQAYTDAPGTIKISQTNTDDQIILCIEDSAPSVNAADCQRLFEPLYRQETSRNRRNAGAGLGLAICQKIIEAHQGRIAASPSLLGGMRFDIYLPRYQETK